MNGIVEAALGQLARVMGHRYPELEKFVRNAAPDVQERVARDLLRLSRDVESEVDRAKRTFRPFPGGPAIRL